MQDTQADINSCKRVGVDEHLIRFKPSPNFKNMKKFIKSRSEIITCGPLIPARAAPDPQRPPNIAKTESHHKLRPDWQKSEVQPPLPLDPPPPDYIPDLKVKQEIVDTDYETNPNCQSPRLGNQEEGQTEQTTEQSSVICRDFIRGTCKREGTCKYAHKHDLSQLEGVYTFCRKYQNAVCTYTNCKYVHATVFEEQHFYRTGILPPHALQHKMNNNMLQPPPPPPPEGPPVLPFNIDFSNPPPPLRNDLAVFYQKYLPEMILTQSLIVHPEHTSESATPIPTFLSMLAGCNTRSSSLEARGFMGDLHNQVPTRNTSPLKRNWSTMESFAPQPCDIAYNEPLSKKCKNCDIMEFRLDHNKNKVKKVLQSKEQLSNKMALLEKQSEKLRSLISELLRPTISSKATPPHMNVSGDKDKSILEQLNSYLSGSSRLSSLGEDK